MATATTHRRFTLTFTPQELVITEVEPTTDKPGTYGGDWGWGFHTRTGAWEVARTQDKPVRFVGRDGKGVSYGVVFSPAAFERACYGGYVAYGQSMTDFVYYPERFENWVIGFRRGPETSIRFGCDVSEEVRRSLPTYLASLAQTV